MGDHVLPSHESTSHFLATLSLVGEGKIAPVANDDPMQVGEPEEDQWAMRQVESASRRSAAVRMQSLVSRGPQQTFRNVKWPRSQSKAL